GVAHDPVVQGAVGLEVGDLGARGTGGGHERVELATQLGEEGPAVEVHIDATEPGDVGVGDVGADADTARDGLAAHDAHRVGVARVAAAGDVGAADDVEHRAVVAHPFAEVDVEVDPHGPIVRRRAPAGRRR